MPKVARPRKNVGTGSTWPSWLGHLGSEGVWYEHFSQSAPPGSGASCSHKRRFGSSSAKSFVFSQRGLLQIFRGFRVAPSLRDRPRARARAEPDPGQRQRNQIKMCRYELINTQFKSIFYYFISFYLLGGFLRAFRFISVGFWDQKESHQSLKALTLMPDTVRVCSRLGALKSFGNPLERSM